MHGSWHQLARAFITVLLDELLDIDGVEELNINVSELASLVVEGALHHFQEAHLSILTRDHLPSHVLLLEQSIVGDMYRDEDQVLRHLHVVVGLDQPLDGVVGGSGVRELTRTKALLVLEYGRHATVLKHFF